MAQDMKLPNLGEGVMEGELVKWLVKPGDAFKPDQPLCEVMTDKATVEIPSHQFGTVSKLIAQEGTIVKPGMPILSYESSTSNAKINISTTSTSTSSPRTDPPPSMAAQMPRAQPAVSMETTAERSQSESFVRSSPSVRKKARELGINLSQVTSSGPGGRVLMEDLLRSSSQVRSGPASTVATAPLTLGEGDQRIPVRGIRKAIAKAMVQSKHSIPHFTYVDEVDVTKLVKLRNYAKEMGAKKNIKVTYLPFYIKAVLAAMKTYPLVNASFDEASQEIIQRGSFNIGIATATPEGLIVPNVKNADQLSILELSRDIYEVTRAAIQGKQKLDDLKGGTFTITNIGSIGGLFATPIINYPEVGILGMYRIIRRPMIKGRKIVARDMTYISLTFDHRVIDGAVAAQFSNEVVQYLQTPELLLLSEDL